MNFKKKFGVDKEKSEQGTWFRYEDAEFLVARTRGDKYRLEINRLSRRYRAQLNMGTLDPKISEDIVIRALANTILNGWRGQVAFDDDGTLLPYTRENAYKVLKEFPDFRDMITSWADDLQAFQDSVEDDDEKNFEISSNGT